MIEGFKHKELEAVSRLMQSQDFMHFMDYLERIRETLSRGSLRLNGPECSRMQGGALTMEDLLMHLQSARQVLVDRQRIQREPKQPKVF